MNPRPRAEAEGPYVRALRGVARTMSMLVAVFAVGCFPPDAGVDPNSDQIYFPTGLALSPAIEPDGTTVAENAEEAVTSQAKRKWLYVANSDFDLQYNAGTVQVLDLDAIQKRTEAYLTSSICPVDANGNPQDASPADRFRSPSPCKAVDVSEFLDVSKFPNRIVRIGAFATDILYVRRPADVTDKGNAQGRLLVPVRGDATLHWIDAKDAGDLDCGAVADDTCDSNHRRGASPPAENTRDLTLLPEPFGIAADVRGESIVMTHQTTGALSLFVNDWKTDGPTLQFELTGLPTSPIGVASVPEPAVSRALSGSTQSPTFYEPGFYVTYRNSAQIQVVRYFSDAGDFETRDYPARPFLDPVATRTITTNSQGFDSRGVAVDPSARTKCEENCLTNPGPDHCHADCVDPPDAHADKTQCNPDLKPPGTCSSYVACLRSCGATPLGVYVSNRTPPTLILGRSVPTPSAVSSDDVPIFYDSEPLPPSSGPSRVVIGHVLVPGPGGTKIPAQRVFVICFDSHEIFVYDPKSLRIESVIRTGRGPHSLAVDETRGLGYVGHFTDSYIGVVDLDQTRTESYGKLILTIGQPVAPRAQK